MVLNILGLLELRENVLREDLTKLDTHLIYQTYITSQFQIHNIRKTYQMS